MRNIQRDPIQGRSELSTEEIIRVAAAHLIQLSGHVEGDSSLSLNHSILLSSGLMVEETKNVHLARLLLHAAEKVSNQQYDQARDLLNQCYQSSSTTGNPVQRLVYYFSKSLQERIHRETGRLSYKRPRERGDDAISTAALLPNHSIMLVAQERIPFSQIIQFTSVQTIIDTVGSAERIHMIDLCINHGVQWTILMQALAKESIRKIDYLKISAVGTREEAIATTGKWLKSFAETLNLPFDFKAVIVKDMEDLKEDMFDVKEGEAICIYSSVNMQTMIVRPEILENLMGVLQKLKPRIMTIADVEGNHNSTSFIKRFIEALFYYGAFFDCLDSFLERNEGNRMAIEGCALLHGIESIVAAEGSERAVRHVGISMWRSFFARFGVVEAELSEWTPFQASLLVKQFNNGSSCTITKNRKSLIVGWKGTPLLFISAWKFQEEEGI